MGKYTAAGADDANKNDLKNAIGWDGEQVQGVEVSRPVFQFELTCYLPVAAVTQTYVRNLMELTGCYNSGTWDAYDAGECLFLGASGRKRGSEDWEISFKFAASPNVVKDEQHGLPGLAVGNITGIEKRGWDYLWVLYEEHTDNDGKKLIPVPKAVYVEEVYYPGDFSVLGILPQDNEPEESGSEGEEPS
jgi:hypothetical protein